jgi:hypothetical protein
MEDMDAEYQLSPQYKSHDEEDTNRMTDHKEIEMHMQLPNTNTFT